MSRRPGRLLALLLCGIACSARAFSPEEEAAVSRGIEALYRNDYDSAEAAFRAPADAEPENPVYALGLAVAAWWRMESRFALPGQPEEKEFLSALDRALRVAKDRAARTPSADHHLCLATAFGLRGRWRAANKRWVGAYLDGRRAHRNASKAIRLDPGLYDAYLGLGAFDYYVARFSRLIRVLAFSSGGDRAEGLRRLELAARNGKFSRTAAKLVLVGIYWTFEKRPDAAWSLVEEVSRSYPDSPVIRSLRLLGRFHLRDLPGLEREAKDYLAAAEKGEPHFEPLDRVVGRTFLGLAEQLAGKPEEALRRYAAALAELPERHRWRSVLELFSGEALDLLGRREEAVERYRRALREPPLWGVPRYARHLLRRPFKAGDNPLPDRTTEL
ncbi:MAG: hypothetical protein HY553_05210 [Elusimicrobia bacterium]|nr:hypothetical protein [Elusimicrobiota bacterium]